MNYYNYKAYRVFLKIYFFIFVDEVKKALHDNKFANVCLNFDIGSASGYIWTFHGENASLYSTQKTNFAILI